MQLLIFSPFLVLGLLTVSVTVTKGKRPRQKLDFEISRLALPTKFFPSSHATPLVHVFCIKTPLLTGKFPNPKLARQAYQLGCRARHSRHFLKTMVAWPFCRSPVFQHGRRIRTKSHSDCLQFYLTLRHSAPIFYRHGQVCHQN